MPFRILIILWAMYITGYSRWANAQTIETLSELSLEELMQMTVTAQRREQTWAQVPASLSIFSEQQLDEQRIFNLNQLAAATPGYIFSRVGNVAASYIRGIGSSLTSISADSSSAVYQDDVYLSRPEMTLGYFWDIQRIEVLKGPQGALYGRNATGGMINLVHNQAQFDQFSGHLSGALGSFNERQFEAVTNIPLGELWAMRASMFALEDDGFTHNINPTANNEIDDQHASGARVQVAFMASANWESRLNLDYFQNNTHGFSVRPIDQYGLAESLGAITPEDFHTTDSNTPSFNDYKTWGADWRLTGNLNFAHIQLISAFRSLDTGYLFNTDGTAAPVTDSGFFNKNQQTSHELRLISEQQQNIDWLLGMYYVYERPKQDVELVRYLLNTSSVISATARTKATSYYGEFTWHLTPVWSSKFGVRFSDEERQVSNTILATGDTLGLNSPQTRSAKPTNSRHRDDNLSPQLVISRTQKSADSTKTTYFSITEGFKSGGSNSLSAAKGFAPEEVISYEIGHKQVDEGSTWSLAAFFYDYDDLQVLAYENGVTSIKNAAAAKVWGMEGTLTLQPVTTLSYQIGATYLSAEYREFISSIGGKPVDVSGNQMPFAPNWDINQRVTHTGLVNNKTYTLSVFHHFQSQTTFNQFEDHNVTQGAFHILNLVGELDISAQWALQMGIFNLTDQEYFRNIVTFTTTSIPAAPQGNALGFTEPGRSWRIGSRMSF